MKRIQTLLIIAGMALILSSCSTADGNYGGSEYMPDMVHSLAYEANVYTIYESNSWDEESTIKRKALSNLHHPVSGTIPRGYAGVKFSGHSSDMSDKLHGRSAVNEMGVPLNGSVPFYYTNTEEERTRARQEIITNPFPISKTGLKTGKELYDIACAICHGTKGDGLGYLVNDEVNKLAKYPSQPANLVKDEFINSSNGRFYFAIMHGKNVMGSFKDKLSYEERWQVIHYIRAMQAKSKKATYDESANTLNAQHGTPIEAVGQVEDTAVEMIENQHPEATPVEDHGHGH